MYHCFVGLHVADQCYVAPGFVRIGTANGLGLDGKEVGGAQIDTGTFAEVSL